MKKAGAAAVRELENNWVTATSTHDVKAVQALLAGDYVGVTSGGNIVNKAGFLAEMRRDKNTYESIKNSGVDVRIHEKMAIAVGTTKQKGKSEKGEDFTYNYRWTDVWMERDGGWQCVASQSIRLTGGAGL